MAVATDREFGLFIGGEASEPASGDVRELTEPATGEPLARAAMAGEDDVDCAVAASRIAVEGDWGRTLDLYLETKSVIVSTGAGPINPFGL